MIHVAFAIVFVVAAAFAGVLYIYRGHVKASLVIQAKQAEVSAQSAVNTLKTGVVDELHKAEAAGKLVEGTVQGVVDAHVAQVEAATAAIKAAV